MHGIIKNKTYYKKESESDKLRMGGNSWTISLAEISGKAITDIVYITSEKTYSISYHNAVKKGFVRMFQGEIKLIVPVKCWEVKNVV